MTFAPVSPVLRERALAKLLPQNGVLAALPDEARSRLLPHLGLVDLPVGHQLGDSGGRFARAFFPVAGVASLTPSDAAEDAGLAALVGSEGVVGLPAFLGHAARVGAVVQCAGYGLALGREQLLEEWARGGSFMRVLMRYSRAVAAQMSLVRACQGVHSLEQQLGSILLMCSDRLHGQEPILEQDAAARLLRVDPKRLGAAVDKLRDAGLAAWRGPGLLAAQERAALRTSGCGCASRITAEYERLLPLNGEPAGSAVTATVSSGRDGAPRRVRREFSTARGGLERPHSN